MYQFMVTTTRSGSSFVNSGAGNATLSAPTGGRISTMSLTSGTNKWASRFVVALQLAAWSAVGIVLLEKGIASLQKHSSARQASLENNASHQVTSKSSADFLSVIPLVPIESPTSTAVSKDAESSDVSTARRISVWSETAKVPMGTKGMRSAYDESTRTRAASTNEQATTEDVGGEGTPGNGGEGINSIIESRKNEQPRILNERGEGVNNENEKKVLVEVAVGENRTEVEKTSVSSVEAPGNDEQSKIPGSPATVKVILANPDEPSGLSPSHRKRFLRLGHVNGAGGGGAAAAVAMVAVGAVMLVLGPAVIVLRALDERRQERRFLKLSGEEDLPPSYEQATGSIEQAPTYSSLNLDTIS